MTWHLYACLEEKVQNIKFSLRICFFHLLFSQKINATVVLKTKMTAFKQRTKNRVEDFKRKMGRASVVGTPC